MPTVRSSRSLAVLLCAAASLLVAGCDDDDSGLDGDTHAHDEGHDGTMEAHCEAEDRDDEFALGLMHEGELVRVAIADADPALPIRGDNTWILAITDPSGAAMEGMSLTVTPRMPDHGHGSPVQTSVTPMPDGEYRIEPINLFMAGYWEITVAATDGAGEADEVVFKVCVE